MTTLAPEFTGTIALTAERHGADPAAPWSARLTKDGVVRTLHSRETFRLAAREMELKCFGADDAPDRFTTRGAMQPAEESK